MVPISAQLVLFCSIYKKNQNSGFAHKMCVNVNCSCSGSEGVGQYNLELYCVN